ncbi:MAG: hypothetical protein WAL75_09475 [Terracidiphilus sp.]
MFESITDLAGKLAATGYFIDPVMTQVVFLAAKLQKPLLLEGPAGSGKAEVVFWIEQNWLQASVADQGKRRFYFITPEALKDLYRHHRGDLIKRGIRNQALFEAYVEYCFAPKHTIGEQLLDVRRDKRERAAFAALGDQATDNEEEDDSDEIDPDMDGRYRIEMAERGSSEGDPGNGEA